MCHTRDDLVSATVAELGVCRKPLQSDHGASHALQRKESVLYSVCKPTHLICCQKRSTRRNSHQQPLLTSQPASSLHRVIAAHLQGVGHEGQMMAWEGYIAGKFASWPVQTLPPHMNL